MDERIRQLLRELGNAINESISSSADVNERIQRLRDEGYNLYVVLDATIGLDKEGETSAGTQPVGNEAPPGDTPRKDAQFRINLNDLGFLRSIGIDPTRKVRTPKRIEGRTDSGSSGS